jgi:hypothetical protein
MFCLKKDVVTGVWKKLHNEELRNFAFQEDEVSSTILINREDEKFLKDFS